MPKRRRERDRPKLRPDGPYNPHKRVMLNYDSAEEELEDGNNLSNQNSSSGTSRHIFRQHIASSDAREPGAVRQIEDEPVATAGTAASPDVSDRMARSGRPRQNQSRTTREDAHEGQRVTFGPGGLGSGNDEWDACYEADTADALAYLQNVRTEREAIPAVLISEDLKSNFTRQEDDDLVDADEFEDDSMVEPDEDQSDDYDAEALQRIACAAYTESLLTRFDTLHNTIELPLNAEALAALENSKLYRIKVSEKDSCRAWKRMIRRDPPYIDQLRAMSPHTARQALDIIQSSFLQPGRHIARLTSIWVMSLMARLEEYPRMHMEKVGDLRVLAKQAVLVKRALDQNTLTAASAVHGNTEQQDSDSIRSSSPENDLDAHHSDEQSRRGNTLATLDMILAIIGERFGQRDFLSERTWQDWWTEF